MSNATKNDNTTFYIKLINDIWTDLLLKTYTEKCSLFLKGLIF